MYMFFRVQQKQKLKVLIKVPGAPNRLISNFKNLLRSDLHDIQFKAINLSISHYFAI